LNNKLETLGKAQRASTWRRRSDLGKIQGIEISPAAKSHGLYSMR